jgi:hypothetical protein
MKSGPYLMRSPDSRAQTGANQPRIPLAKYAVS